MMGWRATAGLALLSTGCAPARVQSALVTAGPGADRLQDLWWILLVVTVVPTLITFGIIAWAMLRRKRPGIGYGNAADGREIKWALFAGGVVPGFILVGLSVATFRIGEETAEPPGPAALTIEVVGRQFWWEVRYPDHGIVTANEIHIPVGQPVRLRLLSGDVIHSFWVPALHGKLDMIPPHENLFWIQADRPGAYRGQCAEFCGLQHALMSFWVFADPDDQFESWLEQQQRPATTPTDPEAQRGLQVFHDRGCVPCHVVRGLTPPLATGMVGPDLTHMATRRTLGAATFDNNRGNLAGWIIDPQALKPGNLMPKTPMPPDELHALVAFLEGLR